MCRPTSGECEPSWGSASLTQPFPPTVVHGVAYVADHAGDLSAFPSSCTGSCEPTWRWHVPDGGALSDPVASGDRLIVSSTKGHVYAFELPERRSGGGSLGFAPALFGILAVVGVAAVALATRRRRHSRATAPS
jgi:hypothetical protein